MNHAKFELIAFRLAVAISVISIAFFGSRALSASDEAHDKKVAALLRYTGYQKIDSLCAVNPNDTSCDADTYKNATTYIETDAKASLAAQRIYDHQFYLTWVIPIILFALFYGIRWAVTGKFLPLRPRSNEISS